MDIDQKLPNHVKNDYRMRELSVYEPPFKRSPYLEGGNIILGNKLLLQHHLCGHDDLGRENMHVICIGKLEQAAGWWGKAVIRRQITSQPTTPRQPQNPSRNVSKTLLRIKLLLGIFRGKYLRCGKSTKNFLNTSLWWDVSAKKIIIHISRCSPLNPNIFSINLGIKSITRCFTLWWKVSELRANFWENLRQKHHRCLPCMMRCVQKQMGRAR